MYIGTQASLTACTNPNYKELYDDDLAIANILDLVTDSSVKPFMVIGNAENAEKSEYKRQIWKSLITTKFFPTVTGRVTKETLYQYVSWFVNKNRNRLCKVVIGHGGAWDSKNNPYAFKDPCEQLVEKYSNLHIVSKKLRFGKLFDVLHLHNGKTNQYKIKRGGIVKCEKCDNNKSSYAVEYKDDFHITEICEECLDKDQEKFKLMFDFT